MSLKIICPIALLLTSLIGCNRSDCSIAFKNFVRHEAPLIYIIKQKKNCCYRFEGYFWFQERKIISEGDLVFDEEAIFLRLESIESSKIKYFDFSNKIGEEYEIVFGPNNSSLSSLNIFSARIEKIVSSTNRPDVFIFRINEGFIPGEEFGEYRADLIFFVTKENGIIGSYISEFEGDLEYVIEQRGDILQGVLDYSTKEFRNIE